MDLLEARDLGQALTHEGTLGGQVGVVAKVGRTHYQVDVAITVWQVPFRFPELAAPTLERKVREDVRCE